MLTTWRLSMEEHSKQEASVDVAQRPQKKRSRSQKIGRLKYNQYLLKQCLSVLKDVRDLQRVILNGLKGAGYFNFDIPWVQKLACQDQLDLEILDLVHQAGRSGVFPKDVAAALPEYKDLKGHPIQHYHVSRRIQRMNKRLKYETGEVLFEKRGHKWALTLFGFESYGDVERHSVEEFSVESEKLETDQL
jgi:hypothetical protein